MAHLFRTGVTSDNFAVACGVAAAISTANGKRRPAGPSETPARRPSSQRRPWASPNASLSNYKL